MSFMCYTLFNSPVMLRKFDSGVMVIQSKSHSDEEVITFILKYCLSLKSFTSYTSKWIYLLFIVIFFIVDDGED